VLVGGETNSEVDVRRARHGVSALAYLADRLPLDHLRAFADGHVSELQQRDRVAVAGSDRHRTAAVGNASDERHRSAGRCTDGAADIGGDVDAAVLTTGIGISAEGERSQHCAISGPAPGGGSGSKDESEHGQERDHPAHLAPPFVAFDPRSHGRDGATTTSMRATELSRCCHRDDS
jgi:hypothetical protein